MKKRVYKLLVVFFLSIILMGCSTQKGKEEVKLSEDTVVVYDKEGQLINEIKEEESLKYFTSLITKAIENVEEIGIEDYYKETPPDPQLEYHYKIEKKSGEIMDLYVLSNHPLATLENAPDIPSINIELEAEDHRKLLHPNDFSKSE